ncbi:MAG: hypothetical protein K8S62_05145 [Candidatus Sabulitectum sp.]|nr:hypothetical protein [Candidatus Sabulitectum sp.]
MKTKLFLPVIAAIFLTLAVISGTSVSRRASIDTFQHIEVFGTGLQRLKHFIASALYLQLDDYHHIEMYQGIPWSSVTDYLPQMWLIARLDPTFTDIYTDAAYHLAINLGSLEEGMDFIREGVQNNPNSLDVRFEYAYLLWETDTGNEERIIDETLIYRALVRRINGDIDNPYNEPSSATIMAEVFKAETDSLNPYSIFYRRRSTLIRGAMREGLYYPDYMSPPPEFLTAESMEGLK